MSINTPNSDHETPIQRSADDFLLPQLTDNDELDKVVEIAGYTYDPTQDIFISNMDPWQRNLGYCRLYDEAAAPLGMIIDCEPIYFAYKEKKWMISFWKGQYDLVTGCEIGVYTESLDLNIFGAFTGTFYNSASNDDRLQLSFTLKKNGNTLFTRDGKHWWLTGFKLGEFSEPSDLSMEIEITLHDATMRDAFVSGLRNAGYTNREFKIDGNTVNFTFDIPHTPQPFTRTSEIDRFIQRKNELLCESYQEITKSYNNIQEKVKAIEEQAPELYEKVLKIGKKKPSYEIFNLMFMVGMFLLSLVRGSKA
jgi:hypothetical protein